MASAWGKSWGSSWGNAWGVLASIAPEVEDVLGGRRRKARQSLTVEEVQQQWELFDLRTQDSPKIAPAATTIPPSAKPEKIAEQAATVTGDVSLSIPALSQSARAAIPAIGYLPDAALMPLAPDAAKAAIEAKRKGNNDALLAILMEL